MDLKKNNFIDFISNKEKDFIFITSQLLTIYLIIYWKNLNLELSIKKIKL